MAQVLVVEDDEIVGQAVCRSLRHAGLQPHLVVSFAQAQESLGTGGWAACSTDLTLSNSDGLAVVRACVAAGVPVVVFTAHVDAALRSEALTQGAAEYLTKPEGLVQLAPTLWRLIRTEEARMGEQTKNEMEAIPEGEAREAAKRVLGRRASDKRAAMNNRFGWGMLVVGAVIAVSSIASDLLRGQSVEFPLSVMTPVILLVFGGGALIQGVTLDRILTAYRGRGQSPPEEPPT